MESGKSLSGGVRIHSLPKHLVFNWCSRYDSKQCSPNCGCVLRFEVGLSPPTPFNTSPTVVHATYHAKRVMTTSKNGERKPLMTTHASLSSQPILTTCTCPTLHQLASQVVEHLPGKSLQTLKNETGLGVVGIRSSIPFRHSVLKDYVLPALKVGKKEWQLSSKEEKNSNEGNSPGKFRETEQHFHCYDLLEESLLMLLHERHVEARKDSMVESFSPTMGGQFAMYSRTKNMKTNLFDDSGEHNKSKSKRATMMHEGRGWLYNMSPSSYFLFEQDNTSYFQQVKDAMITILFGKVEESAQIGRNGVEQRPTTTYLQLLDMYGNLSIDEEIKDDKLDDWVNYVDQIRDQNTTTG